MWMGAGLSFDIPKTKEYHRRPTLLYTGFELTFLESWQMLVLKKFISGLSLMR